MNKNPKICVVGSSNYDLTAYTQRVPKSGETIIGQKFEMGFGGKGANQAVAAAMLGAKVTMVTKLGDDVFGRDTLANYQKLGFNEKFIYFTDEASSGVAPITVDGDGNNSIIVVPGANDLLTEDDVEAARETIADSKAMICQMEIPLSVSRKALLIAREEGVTTIFNPSPAPADGIPDDVIELADILCPNESETELLTGMPVETIEEVVAAGRMLLKKGPKMLIITLGSRGSLIVESDAYTHIETEKVKTVDTTGAGDCFLGSFAYFMSAGFDLESSVRRANRVAAMSVQKPGAQRSYSAAKDLPEEWFT